MGVDENKATLTDALERLNAGDVDGYMEIYDARSITHGLGPEPIDREGVRGFYQALSAGFPDGNINFEDVLADGDRVVARFTFSGTHEGEFMGVAPSGNQVEIGGISILRFANGRVVERWTNADVLGMLVQIGAMPAPAMS